MDAIRRTGQAWAEPTPVAKRETWIGLSKAGSWWPSPRRPARRRGHPRDAWRAHRAVEHEFGWSTCRRRCVWPESAALFGGSSPRTRSAGPRRHGGRAHAHLDGDLLRGVHHRRPGLSAGGGAGPVDPPRRAGRASAARRMKSRAAGLVSPSERLSRRHTRHSRSDFVDRDGYIPLRSLGDRQRSCA